MSLHQHYLYDIAISYAGEDRSYAEALANELRNRGVKVFYDNYEKSDMWGKNLYTHLSDIYRNKALYCVMFLSHHYPNKQWAKHEREFAQARAFSENEEYILLVRLDHTEIPGISPTIAYLSWPPETAETIADAIIAKMYDPYKDLFTDASKILFKRQISEALRLLEPLKFSQIPPLYRWRLAAVRGRCYFECELFIKAQGDLLYAVREEPQHEALPQDQKQECMLLHLRLAATHRELHQLNNSLEQFDIALTMMNNNTPFDYVAEAHWGKSLIAFVQATTMEPSERNESEREAKLFLALEHAENAHLLYRSIGNTLRAATVGCHVAEIELALGRKERASHALLELIDIWKLNGSQTETVNAEEQRRQKELANVVSSASCLLADIELTNEHYEQALSYAEQALAAGERSYILRRADAYVMFGRIYSALCNDKQAEQAYRDALSELEKTDYIGARISTHVRFGSYLLSIGKIEEGQQELAKVRLLSDSVLHRRYTN